LSHCCRRKAWQDESFGTTTAPAVEAGSLGSGLTPFGWLNKLFAEKHLR
jgi:hypothetical protein